MATRMEDLPRGIRNNNPGNIRRSSARWRGQRAQQKDLSFVEFETPVAGLRALMILLLTYYRRYGLDTVEAIVGRFAPPAENATDHYVWSVAKHMGVKRGEKLLVPSQATLCALAKAIVRHENGRAPKTRHNGAWYPPGFYAEAARLALKKE